MKLLKKHAKVYASFEMLFAALLCYRFLWVMKTTH